MYVYTWFEIISILQLWISLRISLFRRLVKFIKLGLANRIFCIIFPRAFPATSRQFYLHESVGNRRKNKSPIRFITCFQCFYFCNLVTSGVNVWGKKILLPPIVQPSHSRLWKTVLPAPKSWKLVRIKNEEASRRKFL